MTQTHDTTATSTATLELQVVFKTAKDSSSGISPDEVRSAFAEARFSKVPLYTVRLDEDGVGYTEIPDSIGIAKDNGRVLNVVSPGYAIHQYEQSLLDPAQELLQVADGDAYIQAYGLTNWGGRAFISVGLTEPVVLGGYDIINPYAFLSGSGDGSWATTQRIGNFRMFCTNQLTSFQRSRAAVKIRHTSKSVDRLPLINATLIGLITEASELRTIGERLMSTPFTERQLLSVHSRLTPEPEATGENKAACTRWQNRRDELLQCYRFDPRVSPLKGSAWGAYQAFSTLNIHGGNVRRNRDARTVEMVASGKIATYDHKVLRLIESS